jgi:hypothetical protein
LISNCQNHLVVPSILCTPSLFSFGGRSDRVSSSYWRRNTDGGGSNLWSRLNSGENSRRAIQSIRSSLHLIWAISYGLSSNLSPVRSALARRRYALSHFFQTRVSRCSVVFTIPSGKTLRHFFVLILLLELQTLHLPMLLDAIIFYSPNTEPRELVPRRNLVNPRLSLSKGRILSSESKIYSLKASFPRPPVRASS